MDIRSAEATEGGGGSVYAKHFCKVKDSDGKRGKLKKVAASPY